MHKGTTGPVARWLAALPLVLVLAGCGGSDEQKDALSADERTAADNLASQIRTSGDVAGGSSVSADDARCIAEGAVSKVGLEELQGYQIITDDLLVNKGIQGVVMKPTDAKALAGVFVDCLDTERFFERQFLGGGQAAKLDAEQRACVRDAIDEDAVRGILSASFEGRTTHVYDGLERALRPCRPTREPAR